MLLRQLSELQSCANDLGQQGEGSDPVNRVWKPEVGGGGDKWPWRFWLGRGGDLAEGGPREARCSDVFAVAGFYSVLPSHSSENYDDLLLYRSGGWAG